MVNRQLEIVVLNHKICWHGFTINSRSSDAMVAANFRAHSKTNFVNVRDYGIIRSAILGG